MQVETLVRAAAQAVTITTLTKGNVYKRLAKAGFGDDYKAIIGVVQSVDNNGAETMVSALEVSREYGSVKVEHKVFGNGSDLALFALTPEEAQVMLAECSDALDVKVANAERDLEKVTEERARYHGLVATMGEITAPRTVTAVEA